VADQHDGAGFGFDQLDHVIAIAVERRLLRRHGTVHAARQVGRNHLVALGLQPRHDLVPRTTILECAVHQHVGVLRRWHNGRARGERRRQGHQTQPYPNHVRQCNLLGRVVQPLTRFARPL
jgi:hypothetical protein